MAGAARSSGHIALRSEDEVLLACAQRFDGRAYLRDTPYDPLPLLESFVATGDWPEDVDPLHLLAAFHVLHRRLMAWGRRPVPRDGRLWFVFRALFLAVAPLSVPARYRRPSGWARWQERYAPQVPAILSVVQGIHEHTAYREEALSLD